MSGGVSASTIFAGIAAAGAGISAISTLTADKGGSPTAAAPVAAAPTVMPLPDDAAMKLAQRKSLAAQQARRGRDSTILSDPTSSDLLGG